MKNLFDSLTKEELKVINDNRIKTKEEELRTRSFDKYIKELMKKLPCNCI